MEKKQSEILDITIPPGALVRCPMRRFEWISIAAYCPACPSFSGLLDVKNGEAGEFGFSDRYRIQCNAPRVLEILQADLG